MNLVLSCFTLSAPPAQFHSGVSGLEQKYQKLKLLEWTPFELGQMRGKKKISLCNLGEPNL